MALGNFNNVTDRGLIELIVDAERCSAFYVFAIPWMPDLEINGNFDALVAAVAYYHGSCSFEFSVLHQLISV